MPDRKKFLLRIDPELYEALHRWADDELRSVNSHIEFLLRQALRRSGRQRIQEAETKDETTGDEQP